MKTLLKYEMDGRAALGAVIAQSEYGSLAQAMASLSLFTHPDTVAETGGKALFPIIRDFANRGTTARVGGRLVGRDDNKAPTDAFMWANGLTQRPRDVQFNHVYARSDDPDCYTALVNISVSPAFLAKLTDTHPEVKALMEYRVYDLYGWVPEGVATPDRPEGYGALIWADPLPPVQSVREAVETRLGRYSRGRTAVMVQETGWLYGEPEEGGEDA